ncbi:oligosaccharide flippase family protein [bacterium]|nr:oligosaccharide flippase family protein [bacterium]
MSLGRSFNENVVWNFASVGIMAISGVVVNWIIARYISAEALGVYNQVFAIYLLLSQFAVGGVHLSVLKHISYRQDDRERNSEIATNGLFLSFVLSCVFAFLAFQFRDFAGLVLNSDAVATGIVFIVPGLVVFSLNKVMLNILNGCNQMRSYAIFQASRYLIIVLFVVLITVGHYPTAILPIALTASELILFLFLFPFVHFYSTKFNINAIRLNWLIDHFQFGVKGFLSGALLTVNNWIPILILGIFLSDSEVGVFSFAFTLAVGFHSLGEVFRRNVDPLLGKNFAAKNAVYIEQIAPKLQRQVFLLLGVIGLAATVCYPVLLKWFVGNPAYDKSWSIFIILMAGVVISAPTKPFVGILLQRGHPALHTTMVFILVLLNVSGNIILIPLLGMNGAALAASFAWMMEVVLLIYFSARFCDIRLDRFLRFSSPVRNSNEA